MVLAPDRLQRIIHIAASFTPKTRDDGRSNMSTILVTGGAGYIGSHTCKALSAEGLTCVTFDNLSRGHADLVQWGPLVVGDVRDVSALDQAFRQYRPDAVIHFAALAYVGESFENPLAYYQINVSGMINVLDAMVKNGTKNILFSSSCATYGIPETVPISEGGASTSDQSLWAIKAGVRTYPQRRGDRATDCSSEFFATLTLVAQIVVVNLRSAMLLRLTWFHSQSMPPLVRDLHYRFLARTIQQLTERASATSYMFRPCYGSCRGRSPSRREQSVISSKCRVWTGAFGSPSGVEQLSALSASLSL